MLELRCCNLRFKIGLRCLDDSTRSETLHEREYLMVSYLKLVPQIVHSDKSNNSKIKTQLFFASCIRNEGEGASFHCILSNIRASPSSFNSSLEWKELRRQWQPRGKSCENGREQREGGRSRKELSGSI